MVDTLLEQGTGHGLAQLFGMVWMDGLRHFGCAQGPVQLALFRTSPINTPNIAAIKQQNTAVQQLNWTKNLKFDSETTPPTLVTENVSIRISLDKMLRC